MAIYTYTIDATTGAMTATQKDAPSILDGVIAESGMSDSIATSMDKWVGKAVWWGANQILASKMTRSRLMKGGVDVTAVPPIASVLY
jgi:hypothetical protein